MHYYGMNISKVTKEYKECEPQKPVEEEKAAKVFMCPDCGSELLVDGKMCYCPNPDCGQKFKKDELENDFWLLRMKANANENGVGKAKGPMDLGLTQTQYNLVIAVILLYGFIINIFEVCFLTDLVLQMNPLMLILGYIASCFLGIRLSEKSDNPYVSFFGYNLVVLPVGLVLTVFLWSYDPYVVFEACCLTTAFTLLMIMAGTCFPKFFLGQGKALLTALVILIISDLALIFGFRVLDPSFRTIFASGLFCMYIAFDWARAQRMEYTLDNAVDVTVAIYLDVINLLIALLRKDK